VSKELVEEWFNTSQQSYWSRRGATVNITDVMTPRFMTGEIHTRYGLDIYKKHSSIFKITNDDCILAGAKENRACHIGDSKLHKLVCGDYVYSENGQVPCGPDCETSNDDSKPFFCILCGRHKKSKNKDGNWISRRWHDTHLPESIEPKWETVCFKEAEMNRQVEPAYLDPHGFILVLRIHYVIAMVRAYEMRAEVELKEEIRRVLYIMMPGDKDVAIVAVEYFEHFLAFHGNFKFADMPVLTACAAHLVLFQTSKISDQHVILKESNAPDFPDFGELVELAADKIHIWASCLMMLGLETNLPIRLGNSQ
jgi:hypothetical protein